MKKKVELREFINEIGLTWKKQNLVTSKKLAVKFSRMCRKIGKKKHVFENDRR